MHAEGGTRPESKPYGYLMLVLFVLFSFRVLAQLVQGWHPLPFLPSFEAWQSGALPYEFLLAAQIVIMAACLTAIRRFIAGSVMPSIRNGKIALTLGIVYFSVMLVRLIAGLTVASDHFWFRARLPTLFHLVLASFVILYGHFHYRFSRATASSQKQSRP